jgi:hypothetical protein
MVDEARDVTADIGVADPAPIHGETPDLPAFQIPRLALQALFMVDQLAIVGDDAPVLVDGFEREYAPTVQW